MKKYAMILLNRVIDIEISDCIPYYPPDMNGNEVIAIKFDGDIKIGMFYDFEKRIFYNSSVNEEITQLDRIEKALQSSIKDVEKTAVDNYTLELMKEGML